MSNLCSNKTILVQPETTGTEAHQASEVTPETAAPTGLRQTGAATGQEWTSDIKFGEIHNFNTGNYYCEQGQPISWATFETKKGEKGIMFQDHGRGITKPIPMRQGDVKPAVVHGSLDDHYVAQCERIGIYHHMDSTYNMENEFRMLPKGTLAPLKR